MEARRDGGSRPGDALGEGVDDVDRPAVGETEDEEEVERSGFVADGVSDAVCETDCEAEKGDADSLGLDDTVIDVVCEEVLVTESLADGDMLADALGDGEISSAGVSAPDG